MTKKRKFRPCAYWNKAGKMVEVFFTPDMYVAHWVTPWVTVLIDPETKKVAGFQFPDKKEARRILSLLGKALKTLNEPTPKMTKKEEEEFQAFLSGLRK